MRMQTAFAVLTLAVAPAGAAFATDYYVAPPGTVQSCTADGSQACPWIGLGAAFSSKQIVGGDRLLLLDGDYGPSPKLYMLSFSSPVTIESLNGKNAHLDNILVNSGTTNLTFRNLSVWPTDPHSLAGSYIIVSYTDTSDIVLDGLDIRSGSDAADYMGWSQDEWLARYATAAQLRGPNSIIENSTAIGVRFGLSIGGANSQLLNNSVEGFSGDSYDVNGDNSIASGNSAKNCFQVDTNHMDALQSYVTSGDPDGWLTGLTFKNNSFIEWASTSTNPLRCNLQGITMFDGPYKNVVIQNNLVSATASHGISVYGGHNIQILNNTVVNNNGVDGKYPWIYVTRQKNGDLASNILIANNLAMSLMVDSSITSATTLVDNSTVMGMSRVFTDIAAYDYIPLPASGFIDTGDPSYAPATDITGAPRPYGAGPDRGAYEAGSTATSSTTGSTATGGGIRLIGHGSMKAKFVKAKKLKN